jgi:hypothetical protein
MVTRTITVQYECDGCGMTVSMPLRGCVEGNYGETLTEDTDFAVSEYGWIIKPHGLGSDYCPHCVSRLGMGTPTLGGGEHV